MEPNHQKEHKFISHKIIRFALTGVLTTMIHFFIAIFSIEYLIFLPPLANGIAFIGANIFSYFINSVWSFSSIPNFRTSLGYLVVSVMGLCLSVSISFVMYKLGFSYFIGIAAVILIVTPLTFLTHNYWTFR